MSSLRDELSLALAESKGGAAGLLDLAWDLEVKLPGTRAAFRDGTLRVSKARIIADAARTLDPGQARAAEALVLGRAGRLTPGGLRAAIARAVMASRPGRRPASAARRPPRTPGWSGGPRTPGTPPWSAGNCRPPRCWPPTSGSPGGRSSCKKAGLDGDDGRAPRPRLPGHPARQGLPPGPGRRGPTTTVPGTADQARRDRPGRRPADRGQAPGPGGCRPDSPAGSTSRSRWPPCSDLADRPGEIPGIGPIDPALARDLARAAAGHPRTTWCVTVTDADGHAIGHGCARPEPARPAADPARLQQRGPPGGHDPPGAATGSGGPGFAFTAARPHGPPGGYGTWRLATGDPRTAGPDHRARTDRHRPVRSPARGPRPRPGRHAAAPVAGPARHLHRPDLPAARRPVRLRTQHALRGRRPDVHVQRRPQVPARPSAQAGPPLASRATRKRRGPVDQPVGTAVHQRTHPLPDLNQGFVRRRGPGPPAGRREPRSSRGS